MSQKTILEVKDLRKVFPGTEALKGVDFDLNKGEIHAIVGENGAGKSTLVKIISGVHLKTEGEIYLDGKLTEFNSVEESKSLGISMVYQELSNIPMLSIAENLYLNELPKNRFGFIDYINLYNKAQEEFARFNLDIDVRKPFSTLTTAEKQFVEIIRVVISENKKIIILDEPTSSLMKSEINRFFKIIKTMSLEGISIIYISHRLDEIVEIADRVTILRDGNNMGTMTKGQFNQEKIVELMIGYRPESSEVGEYHNDEIVYEVKNLNIKNKISDFSIKIHKGEIVALVGLMGSGKDVLVKGLFGLWPCVSKEIYFKDKRININYPREAIRLGIVYLPEERKQAIFQGLSVRKNISTIWLYRVFNKFIINTKKEKRLVKESIEKFNIKTESDETPILSLSGGNQQKAIIARLVNIKPSIMIMNDPTRGVDIGSKGEIHELIKSMSKNGTSFLLVSSEMEEVLNLADRVVVLSKGQIQGEFTGKDISMKNLLTCVMRAK